MQTLLIVTNVTLVPINPTNASKKIRENILMSFIIISSLANKIQISKTTWMLLSMKGGYEMEERGLVEVKVSLI